VSRLRTYHVAAVVECLALSDATRSSRDLPVRDWTTSFLLLVYRSARNRTLGPSMHLTGGLAYLPA
jgi:hypothetical protein